MVDDNEISTMRGLFFARTDTFPLQLENGSYTRVERGLFDEDLKDHLEGRITLGSYQLDRESMVRWIVWDLDSENHQEEAKRIHDLLGQTPFHRARLLEFTGGRGSHCWLFVRPTKAKRARRFAHRIAEAAGVNCEIFPKQDSVGEEGFGSLTKLPLGVHQKTGNESVLIDPPTLGEIEPAEFEDEEVQEEEKPAFTQEFVPFVRCPAVTRINQGVGEGMRDAAGFFKARVYLHAGLSKNEAEAALLVWNAKNRPPMDRTQVLEKVSSEYRKKYSVGPWSIRKNQLLSVLCEPCTRPICLKGKSKTFKRKSNESKRGVNYVF